MNYPISRTYLTEINLGSGTPTNGNQINFQDYPAVRDAFIFGIMAGDASILATSPNNATVVGSLTGLTLTLTQEPSQERIYRYPCFDLNPANAGGFIRYFQPFKLNLVKSYITIQNATGLNANESVLFNILYYTGDEFKQILARQKQRKK